MDDGDASTTTGAGGERARGGDSRDSRAGETGAAPDQGRAGERSWECLPATLCLELDRGFDMCAVSETIPEPCTFTPPAPGTYESHCYY